MATVAGRQKRQQPQRRERQHLTDAVIRGTSPHKVDREQGVIYGVKVLGWESSNGRRYLREAVAKALRMYEGASVRINHPKTSSDQRQAGEVFGELRSVRVSDDGMFADLHYLKTHPLAGPITEAAERMPRQFGLSHNAEGSGRTEGGVYVVEEITEVHSVDVVADPATTSGLFEGKNMGQVKVVDFLESVAAKLPRPKRIKLLRILEDDMMPGDAMMDEPAPPADQSPEDALKQGFRAAAMAALDAALDGDEEAGKKIMEMIKMHGKMNAPKPSEKVEEDDEEDEEKVTEGEGDDDDDKKVKECEDEDKDKKPMEGKQRKGKPLSALDAIALCEDAGVSYDRTLLECLCMATDEATRKRIVDREKKVQAKIVQESGKVRTQKPGASTLTESNDGPTTWAKLAESRNGAARK